MNAIVRVKEEEGGDLQELRVKRARGVKLEPGVPPSQMLVHYPDCLGDKKGGALGGPREALCARRHGMMEWFSLHLQARSMLMTC